MTLVCVDCAASIWCACSAQDSGHCLCCRYTRTGDAICHDCVAESDNLNRPEYLAGAEQLTAAGPGHSSSNSLLRTAAGSAADLETPCS